MAYTTLLFARQTPAPLPPAASLSLLFCPQLQLVLDALLLR